MTRRKLVNPVRVHGSDTLTADESDWTLTETEQTEALNCCVHERTPSPTVSSGMKRAGDSTGAGDSKRQAIDFSLLNTNLLLEAQRRQMKTEVSESTTQALAQILPPLCNLPGLSESLLLHSTLSNFLPVDFTSSLPKPPSADLLQAMPALQPAYAAVVARALELQQAAESYKMKLEMAERKKTAVNNAQASPISGALPSVSPMFPGATAAAQTHHHRLSPESDSRMNGKQQRMPSIPNPRRRNDRRSDAEMNEPNREFQPETFVSADAIEQVRLSSLVPEISLPRETYVEIMKKGETSATRVIRMLMKHFFPPEVLAASSLSGTGTYKQILDENTITAIRDFINHRYPKLKNSRLNLCMTDVCVQARRVKTNQTKRGGDHIPMHSFDSAQSPRSISSHSHHDDDLHVSAPSLPLALEQRPLSPCLNLCISESTEGKKRNGDRPSNHVSSRPTASEQSPLSTPSSDELESKLVIETHV